MRLSLLLAPLLLGSCVAGPELVPIGQGAGTSAVQSYYRSAFLGTYSPSPVCAGQELLVEMAPESVYVGETGCNIAGIDRSGDSLALSLAQCRAEGAAQPDRTLTATPTEAGALRISGGGVDATVVPCFD
ncbi:hypothetical protein [Histidinibacterium aquaticum]|uniref:Lipoprotein n=1 Tax=Histidinibacterium aquaticum TaxID=2613962 RepID=A0A5J5GJB9_9RHOB|nr:hypothetical protein [Histidinibacterium aquaticum]KAA9008245.1 hypothetical protein F3S47_12210 [Histidinibacterium aquaticum]